MNKYTWIFVVLTIIAGAYIYISATNLQDARVEVASCIEDAGSDSAKIKVCTDTLNLRLNSY